MNTLAWCVKGVDGHDYFYALFGGTALSFTTAETNSPDVWQFSPEGGQPEAVDWLAEQIDNSEAAGGSLLGEPVEFDLSDAALASILGTPRGAWFYAPLLRDELLAAARPVATVTIGHAGHSARLISTSARLARPEVGAVHLDTSAMTLRTWTGTAWVEMGTTEGTTK